MFCIVTLHGRLVQIAQELNAVGADRRSAVHHEIGQVLDHFVSKFHLLSEGQIVAPEHHRLDQLTEFGFQLDVRHVVRVDVAYVFDDRQKDRLDAGDRAEVLGRALALDLEHLSHDEDDVQNELRVLLGHDHLLLTVEELVQA